MKHVLIVADHSFVVHGIRLALRQTPGLEVVGFHDGRRPVGRLLMEASPDIVIIDDMRRPVDALARLREASETAPDSKRLLLTLNMDDDWLEEVFKAGADAALSKTIDPVAMGSLLRETALGNVVHRWRPPQAETSECPLTLREQEILGLVAHGYTNGRIARELWITQQTVKFHLSNTYRKLGVTNRTEASRYAYVNSLVEPREPVAV